MTQFQMHYCESLVPLIIKKHLDLHICFPMEDQREQGEQKSFLLQFVGVFLLVAMVQIVLIYVKTACSQHQLLLWGRRFCKSLVDITFLFQCKWFLFSWFLWSVILSTRKHFKLLDGLSKDMLFCSTVELLLSITFFNFF